MASTAQMQRPYPPIYTPQSSSPATMSSQPHDQHGRSIYAQSPQIASQMYGYQPYSPMNPGHPSSYAPHASPQQPPHSMMMAPQAGAQMAPQPRASTSAMTSPTTSAQPLPAQRAVLNSPHSGANGMSIPPHNGHQSPPAGGSSSAAPGPIPATTPLVVRQDGDGVQWISFEYSRDRIKMQYIIRCDVEAVNVDTLSQQFKTENCVYPRACCSKDQYRGNRLVYETDCNAVGWALAKLNPLLRGKRGLIQRAVDSWRNSNQDHRLRSRRVRRMAKVNRRHSIQPPAHVPTGPPVAPGVAGSGLSSPGPRPGVAPVSMGPEQLHHHHAQPDGDTSTEVVSGMSYHM